jgi:hypothetical protein
LLTGDDRIEFAVTRGPDDYGTGVEQAMAMLEIARLPYCAAVRRPWDLALFATHGSEVFFTRTATRVHIQHGLGAGKLVDGQDFTYGPKWSLWEGQPKYDLMLEASHEVRRRAVASCPLLRDRIEVVGDLRADQLTRADASRSEHRRRLGLSASDVAVLFISTFGPHGMLGRHGFGFVDEALRWGSPFRVMLVLHPHLWAGRRDERHRLTDLLLPRERRRLIVCGPDQDWRPVLAVADVAVIDHSSLALYWALLARPTVAVPVPSHALSLSAPIAALRAASPLAAEPAELSGAVLSSRERFDARRFAAHRGVIRSFPGQAAERTRAALYRRILLPLPENASSAIRRKASAEQYPSSSLAAPTL